MLWIHQFSIHFCTHHLVANICVHMIRKVHSGRILQPRLKLISCLPSLEKALPKMTLRRSFLTQLDIRRKKVIWNQRGTSHFMFSADKACVIAERWKARYLGQTEQVSTGCEHKDTTAKKIVCDAIYKFLCTQAVHEFLLPLNDGLQPVLPPPHDLFVQFPKMWQALPSRAFHLQ